MEKSVPHGCFTLVQPEIKECIPVFVGRHKKAKPDGLVFIQRSFDVGNGRFLSDAMSDNLLLTNRQNSSGGCFLNNPTGHAAAVAALPMCVRVGPWDSESLAGIKISDVGQPSALTIKFCRIAGINELNGKAVVNALL